MRAKLHPHVRIRGTGSYLPPRVVTNQELEDIVHGYDGTHSGPFPEWVDRVTHIHERRFSDPGDRSADFALVAARQALEDAGLGPDDIDLIVYASFTPSQLLPGDHCRLAETLGVTSAGNFLITAACAGSVYGLGLAYGMIASGVYKNILVIGAETISRALNFHDPVTAILFGDGAGAVVVSWADEAEDGRGMLPPEMRFAYSPRNIHQGNSNIPVDVAVFPDRTLQPGVPLVEQSVVEMESGPNVLRRAVNEMAASTLRCLGYDRKALRQKDPELRATLDRAWIVPHQANGRIIDGLCEKLAVPSERVIRTIYRYGNMSSASNVVALDHAIRRGNTFRRLDEEGRVLEVVDAPEHRIQPGDLVLLPSIGGGYLMGCAGFVL